MGKNDVLENTENGFNGLTRRGFLKGAALSALGAGAAGAGLAGCAPAKSTTKDKESTTSKTTVSSELNSQDYNYTSNSITDFSKSKLFSDWQLGALTIHNRMVKSAAFQLAFLSNNPEEYISYYERMAKGGVEMIWIEDFANIWEVTKSPLKQDYAAYDVKGLLDALHAAGAYVGYQFDTMGSAIGPLVFTENFLGNYSTAEVQSWIQVIIDIAKRLQADGFDAYELNFAANNVGQSFLSRARNNRTDEYGPQSIESRTRFATEVIQGVKKACGDTFIVQVLINGIEGDDQKLGSDSLYNSIEEVKAIAQALEKAGADSLHVRLGPASMHIAQFANDLYFSARGLEGTNGYGNRFDFSRHFQGKLRSEHSGCGMMIDVAGEIKSAVSIPVGAATYMDPAQAPDYFEAALTEGKLDFLVMNRPLCVDPEYINKLRENRINEIAPCTRCLHCFYDPDKKGALMEHCRVNAANWRAYGPDMPEGRTPTPASASKKIMVVGAGPAGMEAARIAAQRGHSVTLYERSSNLGGLLSAAEAIKGPHENLGRLSSYLKHQQEIENVTVITNTEVDKSLIQQKKPDAVILAVGGQRNTLNFSPTNGTQILSFDNVMSTDMGENITILGSNCQAVDTAIYLLSLGKNVTIITPDTMKDFEKGHSINVREFLEPAITARGTKIWPSAEIKSVNDGEIVFESESGIDIAIACDAVIEMCDMKPNTKLIDDLPGITAIAVGDCSDPYNIAEAIASGNLAARRI